MEFRLVNSQDYHEMWEIYQQYIDTTITFEFMMPSLEEFAKRIDHIIEDYACLVCVHEGNIMGYAYAHRFAERAGYNWSAELSVYSSQASKGLKIGQQLYKKLIDICQLQGIQTIYGLVTLGNSASDALHEKLGFKRVGIMNNVGFKNGEWLSCSYYEKVIGDYLNPPHTLIKIKALDLDDILTENKL